MRCALKLRSQRIASEQVATQSLRLTEDGFLAVSGRCYKLATLALTAFAHLLRLPAALLFECPPYVQATLFNWRLGERLAQGAVPSAVGLVIEDGETVLSVLEAHLALLTGSDVFAAVLSQAPRALLNDADGIEVLDFDQRGYIAVTLLVPSSSIECQAGDAVVAGIEIHHDAHGQPCTRVSAVLHRRVCCNGILVRARADGRTVRFRRPRSASCGALRKMQRRVKRMAALAWQGLDAKLGALKQLMCVRVLNPAEAVDGVARRGGLTLSSRERCQILRAIEQDELGRGDTMYHVLNACSRVGTHATARPLAWRRRLLYGCGEVILQQLGAHART
ncbi:MAG TPA: hypothetical protein VNE39_21470 [Planctomycetota bacterium]|nr:hypothetical protein [Planctomycetota bacterium]